MEGFLRSEEFARYRQLILSEIADFVGDRLFRNETDLKELKGSIELARLLIRLPLKVKRNQNIGEMVYKDLKTFEASFVRKALEESIVNKTAK